MLDKLLNFQSLTGQVKKANPVRDQSVTADSNESHRRSSMARRSGESSRGEGTLDGTMHSYLKACERLRRQRQA
jgi:hypothetical protein